MTVPAPGRRSSAGHRRTRRSGRTGRAVWQRKPAESASRGECCASHARDTCEHADTDGISLGVDRASQLHHSGAEARTAAREDCGRPHCARKVGGVPRRLRAWAAEAPTTASHSAAMPTSGPVAGRSIDRSIEAAAPAARADASCKRTVEQSRAPARGVEISTVHRRWSGCGRVETRTWPRLGTGPAGAGSGGGAVAPPWDGAGASAFGADPPGAAPSTMAGLGFGPVCGFGPKSLQAVGCGRPSADGCCTVHGSVLALQLRQRTLN